MAKRLSVKEIMEAARKAGAAKPAGEAPDPVAPADDPEPADADAESVAAPEPRAAASAPAAPTPESLGRPLTLKEKLAAARAGATPAAPAAAPAAPASATPAAAKPKAVPPAAAPLGRPLTMAEKLAAARAGASAAPAAPAAESGASAADAPAAPAPRAVPAPAASLGRPLTMAEKLAAARGGANAPASAAAPAGAAAKPAPAAKAAAATKRELPPLEKMTDPKDLAEAARRAGTRTARGAGADAAAKPAAAKAAKEARPQTVLPRPSKAVAMARDYVRRREFMKIPWVGLGWGSFIAGSAAFTAMMGRFMFPNVLAEPPSTIKVGLPSNFEPNEVNERFKAEWGFWIVRSTRYNGDDIVYAIQSVCTHLGCPPNWLAGEQKFKCPCHGSGFYISGVNFEGPAPRPLERFKVSIGDDGQMVVDKSAKFQEELGQWSDPSSYIAAV